jgi:TRAP transporter 4TM/12TM fusion protein
MAEPNDPQDARQSHEPETARRDDQSQTALIPEELPEEVKRELTEEIERLEDAGFTEDTVKTRTQLHRIWRAIFFVLALALSVFHLYTAIFGTLPSHEQRTFHVGFGLGLAFLLYPGKTDLSRREAIRSWVLTGLGLAGLAWFYASGEAGWHIVVPAAVVLLLVQAARFVPVRIADLPVADILLSFLGFFAGLYVFFNADAILRAGGFHDDVSRAVGAVGIVVILVAAQRVIGTPLVIVAGAVLLYAFFGDQAPGFWQHGGYSVDRIISTQFLGTEGVFSTPVAVSSTFIYLFMIFAAMLQRTGMERFFTDVALGLTGHLTGGTAKVGVLTSAFSGTITGSSVANTVSNGAFTIPMMKRSGYKGEYAGAVEAASSTGGQLAPPVMGAAAFIMIEFTGQPYSEIIKAAIIPAILFFTAQYVMIHYDSKRLGIGGIPRAQLPKVRQLILRKGYLLIPIIVIFVILLQGFTPMRAAVVAIGVAVGINIVAQLVAALFGKWQAMEDKLTPWDLLDGLVHAARLALPIIVATATAGLIAGVITLTGIGLQLGNELVRLANNQLIITGILAMIACLILGIGVPTTANYVITATVAGPALITAGGFDISTKEILIAHLFVYYFGVLADITPPVALAAFAASGIAESNPIRTGVHASRIALGGFVVPYMFLLSPELLLIFGEGENPWLVGAQASATALAGIFILGVAVAGYLDRKLDWWARLVLGGAGLLLVNAELWTDAIGIGAALAVYGWYRWLGHRDREAVATG